MKVLAVLLSSALLLIIMPVKVYGSNLAKSTIVSSNSGYAVEARFYNEPETQIAGNLNGFNSKSYLLFENLNIPSGSTILNANIEITLNDSMGENVNLNIGHDSAFSPSVPQSSKELNQKILNNYSVKSWKNVTRGLDGTKILSPDISSLIQEMVNRSDWDREKSILLFLTDNNSDLNSFIKFYSANSYKEIYKPKLTVSYIPSTQKEVLSTTFEKPLIKIVSPTPTIQPTPTPTITSAIKSKKTVVISRINNGASSDSYISDSTFEDKSMTQSFGKNNSGEMENFLMFEDVSIPKNAKIKNAAISFTLSGATGGNVNVKVFANKNLNTLPPSDLNSFSLASASLTRSNASWNNIPEGKWGTLLTSPDLSSVVQELVDSEAWNDGGHVQFFFKDFNSDKWSDRTFLSGDFTGTDSRPTLLIEYEVELNDVAQTNTQVLNTEDGLNPIDLNLIQTPVLKEN